MLVHRKTFSVKRFGALRDLKITWYRATDGYIRLTNHLQHKSGGYESYQGKSLNVYQENQEPIWIVIIYWITCIH